MELKDGEDIKRLIGADPRMMEVLRCACSLDLPDWMIGAGFVRNRVWDELHGFANPTVSVSSDIDLIYFDADNLDEAQEKEYERKLRLLRDENWSVKNQARMSRSYGSSEDAISQWPETCTCVAVKLVGAGELQLIAPAGIDDLLSLTVRRGLRFEDEARYRQRVREKEWREKWPRLRIV
jgi:hypothetical protein